MTIHAWVVVFVSMVAAAGLACGGRKRYWRASVSCACTRADGGSAATGYAPVPEVCAADQPACAPSQATCAQLLSDAGCNDTPTASACTFDPGWDYCDPYAPG